MIILWPYRETPTFIIVQLTMRKRMTKTTKKYVSREQRLRKAAKNAVASKQNAHAFLVSAGIVGSDGKLAAHLR